MLDRFHTCISVILTAGIEEGIFFDVLGQNIQMPQDVKVCLFRELLQGAVIGLGKGKAVCVKMIGDQLPNRFGKNGGAFSQPVFANSFRAWNYRHCCFCYHYAYVWAKKLD
jgi:hypothetical protein